MLDSDLVLTIYEQVNRLGGLSTLAKLGERENEMVSAYESLEGVALFSVADPQAYSAALSDYISLVILGDVSALMPAILSEIERTKMDSEVEIVTAAILIGGYAVLLLDNAYPSREDAVRARSILSVLVDVHAEIIGDSLGFEVLESFLTLTGSASEELSRIATNQIPLIRVETGIEMPSTLLAYKLYEDPDRAVELIERNKVATPAYMPVSFEALSA